MAKRVLDWKRIGHLLPLCEEVHIRGTAAAKESYRCVDRALREAPHAASDGGACRPVDLHHHRIVAPHSRGPAVCDHANGTAFELEQCVRCVLYINCVGLSALVYTFRDGSRHQGAHSDHRRGEPIHHVAPMRHHIERYAATLSALVVPAWALAFLCLAVENPRSGIDPD